jgi:hypothetical protein
VANYNLIRDKRKKLIKKFNLREDLLEYLSILIKSKDEEEIDESNDVQYEYIDLVFPPNSKPPTQDSNKKINLADFNQIHKMTC